MIRFENIRKKGVLNNVSFTLENGRMCVLSEHETDATAIITVACGLSIPDFGTVETNGNVRFIAKNAPLPNFLTVSEYFDTVRTITQNTDSSAITNEIEAEYGNDVIGTLEALDRYYVAISAALIGAPSAIAVSDPFHGVAFEHREILNKYMDEISEVTPLIYSSYFPSLCRQNERVLVLSSGKCVGYSSAHEIFNVKSPTIVCRAKGNVNKLDLSSIGAEYEISAADGKGISEITVRGDSGTLRESVRDAIASSGMALLSVKGEYDELRRIIAALDKAENEEADLLSVSNSPEKLSADNLSISYDDDEHDYVPVKENKLRSIGFYSDDEDEEKDDEDESTLFSDEGSDEE